MTMKDDDKGLVVVIRSVKVAIGNVMRNEDAQKHEEDNDMEEEELLTHQSIAKELQKEVEQHVQIPKVMQPLTKISPPFPQHLKKKKKDVKFKKFLGIVRNAGICQVLKELVTKKKILDFETIEVSPSCNSIMTKELIKKREDPGEFPIPCTIGMLQFAKALCDLGASINLMPYAIYKQLGLGEQKTTTLRLLMADCSIKHPVGIIYDILVKVYRFIFPTSGAILINVSGHFIQY
ncbi:uncharacterized protein LOC125833109 [Solanum verrucosum]|uniref:uncharacterized protein LOC125833109 n=1 Tax=Solanum verrucosum TaxID=315347 RepID=UPI0020D16238|nr:uncharacterized protein LOC125833109 [Solanum verrucosum]